MADPENQGTVNPDPAPAEKSGGGGSGGQIELSMAYIMSIPGILKIVEFVCIFYIQSKAPPPSDDFFLLLVVLIRNVVGDSRGDEFFYVSPVTVAGTIPYNKGCTSEIIGRYHRNPCSPQTFDYVKTVADSASA